MIEFLTLYNIKNMGRGLPGSSLLREKLIKEYVLYAENEIKYEIYYYKNKDEYIFHFKIPSESNYKYIKPFYYDTLFSFKPIQNMNSGSDSSLNPYKITVFSNMHSFIFTYTYIYYSKKYLIEWVPKKYYTKLALKNSPEKRNYYHIMNYEKSIYFSYLTIIMNNLYKKYILNEKVTKISSYFNVLKNVKTQDDLLIDKKKFDKLYKIKDEKKLNLNKRKYIAKGMVKDHNFKEKFSFLLNNS